MMTNVFAAIGQRRDDPYTLLLLGSDGRHYAQALPDGDPAPIEPDDGWDVDDNPPRADEVAE
ncbi:MAG: hypothetical protein IT337_06105 [Thermomicrobiales bacterium]|nr:hypothetical protein [Thermomicrobiales bacterium]